MNFKDVVALLKEKHADAIEAVDETKRDPWIVVKREKLVELCRTLRDDPKLNYDHLSLISAVDYPPATIEVVYHLDSLTLNHPLVLKVKLNRAEAELPALPKMPTLVGVWITADWHERETFDLMGIEFTGHPNLARILCAEDWVGYPLRKDYAWPEEYHGIPCGPFAGQDVNIPPEWEAEGFTTRKA
jgi:NADH-quinone oxidoreductase subunit C